MKTVFPIKQGVVAPITLSIVDATGAPITLANLSALTLVLWNGEGNETVDAINNRKIGHANSNAKNANFVTVHSTSGLVTWLVQVADTPLVSTTLGIGDTELHLFRLIATHTQSGSPFHELYGMRVERTA
jgi:hypothetical protein